MYTPLRPGRLPGLALAIIIALLLQASGSANDYLQVSGEDARILLRLPLAEEPSWSIEWNHSVTGILVRDFYRFEGGRMLLTASHAPRFDAGLGHIPGRGRVETDEAGGYWILDIDEPVPGNAYLLRVGGSEVGHRIVHGGVTYSLTDMAAGERVKIEVTR